MMKKLVLLIALISINLNAQKVTSVDTTALKTELNDLYNGFRFSSSLEYYEKFLSKAEELKPLIGPKGQKTLSFWLSEKYYRAAKKFNIKEPTTTFAKQVNDPYLDPEVRKQYLLKAKAHLVNYHGGYDEESFKDIDHAILDVEREIKNKG